MKRRIFWSFIAAAGFLFSHSGASAFEIPPRLGHVAGRAAQNEGGKTVVLIEEAHADYGVQKAIAEILKHLVQRESLKLILVEGGWEDMSISHLRKSGTAQSRLKTAEDFLRQGKISGEEYLDITSDLDIRLWGVEDPKLYRENMEAFLKIQGAQEKWIRQCSELESVLERWKSAVFPKELEAFDRKRQAFRRNEISFFDYLAFLHPVREKFSNGVDDFPAIRELFALMGRSNAFDGDKVEWEKRGLIRALSKVLSRFDLDRIELLKDRKAPAEELELLDELLRLYEKYQGKLKSVSIANLKGYRRALRNVVSEESAVLFDELERLEAKLVEEMGLNPEQKRLLEISRAAELIGELVRLELKPEQYRRLEHNSDLFQTRLWRDFLTQKMREAAVGEASMPALEEIQNWIPEAKAFYDSALRREAAMVRNAAEQVNRDGVKIAAFVIGGFHTKRIREALEREGFSVAVVTPRLEHFETKGQADDSSRNYFQILKTNWISADSNSIEPKGRLNLS
jgi:hypothetical protein